MTTALAPPSVAPKSTDTGFRPRYFTVEEYHRAAEAGIFEPEERLELIRGEIIEKMPQNSPHATSIMLARDILADAFGPGYNVRPQLPITLPDDSEPEPDIAVVAGNARDYETGQPQPEHVKLVVEVSDTTLFADTVSKSALYAQHRIPEYWILNLNERTLSVRREPVPIPNSPYGFAYRTVLLLSESERIAPVSVPKATILVADLLPAAHASAGRP